MRSVVFLVVGLMAFLLKVLNVLA